MRGPWSINVTRRHEDPLPQPSSFEAQFHVFADAVGKLADLPRHLDVDLSAVSRRATDKRNE